MQHRQPRRRARLRAAERHRLAHRRLDRHTQLQPRLQRGLRRRLADLLDLRRRRGLRAARRDLDRAGLRRRSAPPRTPTASSRRPTSTRRPTASFVFFTSGEKLTNNSQAEPGIPDLYRYDVASGDARRPDDRRSRRRRRPGRDRRQRRRQPRLLCGHAARSRPGAPDGRAEPLRARRRARRRSSRRSTRASATPNWALDNVEDGPRQPERLDPAVQLARAAARLRQRRASSSSTATTCRATSSSASPAARTDSPATADAAINSAADRRDLARRAARPTSAATSPPTADGYDGVLHQPRAPAGPRHERQVRRLHVGGRRRRAAVSRPERERLAFVDASASGNDAFFLTREQLVGIDTDDQIDLYDARVGGGLAEPEPATATAAVPGRRLQAAGDAADGPAAERHLARSTTRPCRRRRTAARSTSKADKKQRQGRQAPKEGRQGLRQAEEEAEEEAEEGKEAGQVRPAGSRPVQPGLIGDDDKTSPARTEAINTEATMSDRRRHFSRKPRRRPGSAACSPSRWRRCSSLPVARRRRPAQELHRRGPRPKRRPLHPGRRPSVRGLYRHQLQHRTIDGTGPRSVPDESVRTVNVDLPAGLVGNPQNIPQCTREQLTGWPSAAAVPANTQVGRHGAQDRPRRRTSPRPSTTWSRRAGVPAQFGFIALIPPVYINASVRPDGGLSVTIPNISQALPLTGTSLTFWGVPGDPAHDADRGAVPVEPRPDGALSRSRARCCRS